MAVALELKPRSAHYAQFEIRSIGTEVDRNVPIEFTLIGKHGNPRHTRKFEVGSFGAWDERITLAPPRGKDGSAGGMEVDELLDTYGRAVVVVGDGLAEDVAEIPDLRVRWEGLRDADIVDDSRGYSDPLKLEALTVVTLEGISNGIRDVVMEMRSVVANVRLLRERESQRKRTWWDKLRGR